MARIEIRSLVKKFGSFVALSGIDLTIEDGEFIGLLGPSGCGKTTTINTIAGFETPTSGSILMDGRDLLKVPANRRGIGVVFQSYALFPHLTAAENVSFGLEMQKVPRAERRERIDRALALVRLETFADRFPRHLSGGQQQRVALARALAIEPKVLLLDEPLSNLDAKLREEMQVELRLIQKRTGVTTIMVTHDQSEALAICDRIAVMDRGHIVQLADPLTLYDRPRTDFVARFVGRSSRLKGHVLAVDQGGVSVRIEGCEAPMTLPISASPGAEVTLAIRPEKVAIAKGAGRLPGTVISRIFQGSSWLFIVDTPAGQMDVCLLHQSDPEIAEGQRVMLDWAPASMIVAPGEDADV